MKLHHVGIVVRSIRDAMGHYAETLGLRPRGQIVHDPAQDAYLLMLESPDGGPGVELIEPASENSPVARAARLGGGPAHTCYQVDDMKVEIDRMRAGGALVVKPPTEAPLFGGSRVAFLFLKTRHLIELVEGQD